MMAENKQDLVQNLRDQISALESRIAELEESERKSREKIQQLTEKEAFNFALFQFNPILMVIVDLEGRVVKSNLAKRNSGQRLPRIGDIMYKDYASRHEIDMYSELIDAIKNNTVKTFPELKYGNRYLSVTISPFPKGAMIISQDITERKREQNEQAALICNLKHLHEKLLPICACCKRIRNESGKWNSIENYLSRHFNLDFTHTLCPDCIRETYPEYWKHLQENREATEKAK
ncbi:MAG TPA: hypothetical protein PLE24_01115 [Chitinispirillaceae bacterium]|jgi:hypothetical protein|nr:hypothetical protein [Chitinispirillaceae bacterium]